MLLLLSLRLTITCLQFADRVKHSLYEFSKMMEWLQFRLIAVYGNLEFPQHQEIQVRKSCYITHYFYIDKFETQIFSFASTERLVVTQMLTCI